MERGGLGEPLVFGLWPEERFRYNDRGDNELIQEIPFDSHCTS
jgi:hypothetical protein